MEKNGLLNNPLNAKEIDAAMLAVGKATIGISEIADIEAGVLNKIKEHLGHMLDSIYTQVKENNKIVVMDAMLTEQSLVQADPVVIQGLNRITTTLNEKNQEIAKLRTLLASLGAGLDVDKSQSAEMLRERLSELDKRNQRIKKIHAKLLTHPIITGQIPKGINLKEVTKMLENLNVQIKTLHQTNLAMKQQNKVQLRSEQPVGTPNPPYKSPRRGS